MHHFLKLKSWQLFLLLFGIPVIAQLFLKPYFPGESTSNFFVMSPFEIILILSLISWLGVLGFQLNQYVSKDLRPPIKFFNIGIVLPVVSTISLQALFISMPSNSSFSDLVFIIMPLILLYNCSLLYDMYFISKNLLLAEKNDKVKIEDYIGPFLALLFFPIGLWFIQPRINKLVAQKAS